MRSYLAAKDDMTLVEASPEYLLARTMAEEDLELRFLPGDNVVTFRLLAEKPQPMPPFCATRGCINGNASQRKRIEALRDDNGFRSEDSRFDSEKYDGWVPIFLH